MRTVQDAVAEAGAEVMEVPVEVSGASRTDAGVHAKGQVAALRGPKPIPPDRLRQALNAHLPHDVSVLACSLAAEGFDPRRESVDKRYQYRIWNRRSRSPLNARTSWHRRGPLDLEAVRLGVPHLLGEHDYSTFRSAHCSAPHPIRRLDAIDAETDGEGLVTLEVQGNAFLHHMVRNLAGTLVEVGQGRRDPASLGELLASRDRTLAGPTAPAHGLALLWVGYEGDLTAPR